jgi:hypothetical protein
VAVRAPEALSSKERELYRALRDLAESRGERAKAASS